MYENKTVSSERNPVFLYNLYKNKRPEETLVDEAPFYLSINHVSSEKLALPQTKWFKPQPMGVNKLNSLMKDCASAAGIGANKRITNHSARKTLVQTLQDNNVPPTQIVQVTGHKSLVCQQLQYIRGQTTREYIFDFVVDCTPARYCRQKKPNFCRIRRPFSFSAVRIVSWQPHY